MAITVSFTMPNAFATRVGDAYSVIYGYNALTDGTKLDFVKAVITREVQEKVLRYELGLADTTSKTAIKADIDSNVIT